ncbi:MAG: helix-turn-helix domain-containing protein [Anaerolineae bacterium]|nr:helix-turn-helix domain-containing protein [Anaerolineae bacterium]
MPASANQKQILEEMTKSRVLPAGLVERAKIILLSVNGISNGQMRRNCGLSRDKVRHWRKRWLAAQAQLNTIEQQIDKKTGLSNLEELESEMVKVFSDAERSGAPAKFDAETIVKIIALACECPQDSGYPISHWTPQILANEAIKGKIVESISDRSVGRFLKSGTDQTTFKPLLAKQPT